MSRPVLVLAAALALIALTLVALGIRKADASGVIGDTTCDINIGIDDATGILHSTAGLDPGVPCIYNGDTNCNGHYDADDALRIIAHVAESTMKAVAGCLPVGAVYQLTATPVGDPTPSGEESPPPAPSLTPTPTATESPELTPTPTVTPAYTPTAEATPTPLPTPVTGVEPACSVFPADNPWNTDISQAPVDANSDNYLAAIGTSGFLHPDFGTVWAGAPIGIPYVVVGSGQPKVPVSFAYAGESDPGPYPIPPNVPVEGQPVGQANTSNFGGDRHVLVVDDDACALYELFNAHPVSGGASWTAGSGAIFDLTSNELRPETWTSADAAGLPVFAGLVRYSEVQSGVIDHALRFTVSDTQMAYIHPATHYASDITDPDYPPMGLRFRMQAGYDCSWATTEVQVICAAMKKYGMIVADNGSDWYVSGAPDPRWDNDRLGDLKDVPASVFEVVDTGETIHHGY